MSVNPARSFGPATFAGGAAMSQLWLFIIAPLIGAGIAGVLFRIRMLEADGPTLTRMHLRTGSCANWPVLVRVVPGNLMPDFPLINKSFELCYACADR